MRSQTNQFPSQHMVQRSFSLPLNLSQLYWGFCAYIA